MLAISEFGSSLPRSRKLPAKNSEIPEIADIREFTGMSTEARYPLRKCRIRNLSEFEKFCVPSALARTNTECPKPQIDIETIEGSLR
jgi:hypothetical protein